MALPATSVFEIHQAGSDANGGGFSSGGTGTDYSQQDAAQFSGTNLASDGSGNVSSVTHNFVSTDVDNFLNITAGTGLTVGVYRIISVAANKATLDRTPGASGSAGTWAVGGAFATIGKALALMILNGMTCYVKYSATAYSISTGLTIGTGTSFGTSTNIIGYTTTRGDIQSPADIVGGLTRPIVKATAAIVGMTLSGAGVSVQHIEFDGNSTGTQGMVISGTYHNSFVNCRAHHWTTEGYKEAGTAGNAILMCEIDHCAGANGAVYVGSGSVYYCSVHENTVPGIYLLAFGTCIENLVYSNTGASSDGIQVISYDNTVSRNICYGNGRHGINFATYHIMRECANNLLVSNSGFGLVTPMTPARSDPSLHHNAFYNNTSGLRSGVIAGVGDVTLTADPFTNHTTDFSLNATAGGGAALKNVGYPGILPQGGTGYLDIGALRHSDPAAGGSPMPPRFVPGMGRRSTRR